MSVISPGVLSRSRFFHSPILFRESNPAALIASLFAKGKSKNGVPHILESHPRERRARMGHPVTWESNAKTKTGNRVGHPSLWTQMLSQGLGIAAPAA